MANNDESSGPDGGAARDVPETPQDAPTEARVAARSPKRLTLKDRAVEVYLVLAVVLAVGLVVEHSAVHDPTVRSAGLIGMGVLIALLVPIASVAWFVQLVLGRRRIGWISGSAKLAVIAAIVAVLSFLSVPDAGLRRDLTIGFSTVSALATLVMVGVVVGRSRRGQRRRSWVPGVAGDLILEAVALGGLGTGLISQHAIPLATWVTDAASTIGNHSSANIVLPSSQQCPPAYPYYNAPDGKC